MPDKYNNNMELTMFNDTEHETGLDISDTFPPNEIDEDAAIIKADLQKIIRYSTKLNDRINDGDSIDGWIQAKIVKAADYIASVYHYFEFEMELNHVGQKIENSDFYTEDQKAILRAKLIEGRSILAELKIKTAQKLSELTETPKSVKFGRKRKRLGAPSFKTASRKKATGLRKFKKFTSSSVEESASVASTSSSDIPVTTQKMVPTQKAASAFWNTVKQEAKDALDNQKPSTGSDDVFYGEK
jgi:hypothetical protein